MTLTRLMPPSRPKTTEVQAKAVMIAIRITWTNPLIGTPNRIVQPRIDLLTAEPERRGHTEQGARRRKDIDDMADPAINTVADQRVKNRADRQGQAPVEGRKRQGQTDQGVNSPAVKAPV